MLNSKSICAALFLLFTIESGAQSNENFSSRPSGRGEYSLVLYAGGGYSYYLTRTGAPGYLNPTLARWNPMGTLRILWHPDHLLKVGIETGQITFFSYKLTDSLGRKGTIALHATPVLLEWSMSLKKHLNIFAGSGLYILNTKLDYAGKVNSNKLSVGWMAAASYIYPVGKEVGLGAEVKWMYAAETSNGFIGAQLQLVWRFLKW